MIHMIRIANRASETPPLSARVSETRGVRGRAHSQHRTVRAHAISVLITSHKHTHTHTLDQIQARRSTQIPI